MPTTRQRIIVPFEGHVIGQGFNSDTGERVGTGLNVGSVGEDKAADGQTAEFHFEVITSQQSQETALNISAEIEARYMLFSGGAKFSFAQKNAVNSSSTYIVGSCVVNNALRFGSQFTPTENASALLAAARTDDFKQSFGDRFCQALRTGGEFHAVVRVTSSSTKHQSDISASLHAELNGLVGGGSFKASFDFAKNDQSSHTEVHIDIFQLGGQGAQIQMPGADADKLRDVMNSFAQSVHEHPVAFEAELLTYDTLALPGPSVEELDDRRRVFADCQARKQKYWSAIAELEFLQTDDAQKIFADLPPTAQLAALQNEFRRVLNDLMSFARSVSVGKTAPALFVPQNEPVLPHFPRRATTSFSGWWARRDDPLLLADERTLVHRIGAEARKLLATPLETAPADAVQNAAGLLERLDLDFIGAFSTDPALRSIAALPRMIASPIRTLSLTDNELENLEGTETFSRIESIDASRNRITDLAALRGLTGLKTLNLRENKIEDVTPLATLTNLQSLFLDGNSITSLAPLAGLTKLGLLLLGASVPVSTQEGQPPPPPHITDNPILDGRPLASLPHFACPFTASDVVHLRLTTLPDLQDAGGAVLRTLATGGDAGVLEEAQAQRQGNSTEFQFSVNGGAPETMKFIGGLFGEGVESRLWAAVLFPKRKKIGVAIILAERPSASLDRAEVARMFADEPMRMLGPALIGIPPEIIVEVRVS